MALKVEAASRFVESARRRAVMVKPDDALGLMDGSAGTSVVWRKDEKTEEFE
jgi:carbamate kinase